jgi:hypothetical protein
MISILRRQAVRVAIVFFAATSAHSARAAEISVPTMHVGGFYGPYLPGDMPPPGYPMVPAPDNALAFQNYFMGRTTVMGFTTSERRAFFVYDMAGVAASIPGGEAVVGVTIDLTLIPGGTSALANFTGGFEDVRFTSTPVPYEAILDPVGFGVPASSVWATFGTGMDYGSFVLGGPMSPMPTPPATYTIGLPGSVADATAKIATGSLFIVTARLVTYDPGPIGPMAPPAIDPFEYVFGLTDVVSPSGSHAPMPYLKITTAPVPEPASFALASLAAYAGFGAARRSFRSRL